MTLPLDVARLGNPVDLRLADADPFQAAPAPRFVLGQGRGAQATVQSATPSYWICLQGALTATTAFGQLVVPAGQVLVHSEPRLRIGAVGDAEWLGIVAGAGDLHRLLGRMPVLFGSMEAAPPALLAAAAEVAQAGALSPAAVERLLAALAQLDDGLHARIALCPGRTEKTKWQSYQRLLRARNRILVSPGSVDGIDSLAALSSYSSWHFIRLFHQVFGETPMDCAQQLRLDRARHLVETSRIAVSDVAREAGFGTFSAFCRAFRSQYGVTATRWRELAMQRGAAVAGNAQFSQ